MTVAEGILVMLGNIGGVMAQSPADVSLKLGARDAMMERGIGTYILGVLAAVVEDEENLDL